jgi:hypothetical protein
MARKKRNPSERVEVSTKLLLEDWQQKRALIKAYRALKRKASRYEDLKVPLKNLTKKVDDIGMVGRFGPTLYRLGLVPRK